MKRNATKTARDQKSLGPTSKAYFELVTELPLRVIRNDSDYDRAEKVVHRLALREGKLDAGEEAYLEVLEVLVERYDLEHSNIGEELVTPTQVLRMLVGQARMSVTELGRLLGSKGAASELLSGKRKEPSKAQIAKLCERFKVDASLFLLPARKSASAA